MRVRTKLVYFYSVCFQNTSKKISKILLEGFECCEFVGSLVSLFSLQLLLLVGRWMEETAHYEVSNVIRKYKVRLQTATKCL